MTHTTPPSPLLASVLSRRERPGGERKELSGKLQVTLRQWVRHRTRTRTTAAGGRCIWSKKTNKQRTLVKKCRWYLPVLVVELPPFSTFSFSSVHLKCMYCAYGMRGEPFFFLSFFNTWSQFPISFIFSFVSCRYRFLDVFCLFKNQPICQLWLSDAPSYLELYVVLKLLSMLSLMLSVFFILYLKRCVFPFYSVSMSTNNTVWTTMTGSVTCTQKAEV